jgi:hypothetical protein
VKRTSDRNGGDSRQDRDEHEPAPSDDADTWDEQSGYGERVLDAEKGPQAAEEEQQRSEQTDPHGGSR